MQHLFISETDGALYDTRVDGWANKPLRRWFAGTCHDINAPVQLKMTLRAGPYAWPGGYPLYFLTEGGEALSFAAVRDSFREILEAFQTGGDWRVVACVINEEDSELRCAHTNELIPAAYPND